MLKKQKYDSAKTVPDHAPNLFNPFDVNGKGTVRNRIFKAAMSEVLADIGDNLPNEKHYRLYRRWARGGCGIMLSGNVMIDKSALAEPGNVLLEDKSHFDRFVAWADAVRETAYPDTQFWMQLNHPGKQTNKFLTPHPVAPSAIPLRQGLEKMFAPPRAMEGHEIHDAIKRFATASRLSQEAGWDGVQIHCAHGYLISQFLSSYQNQRTDEWGGNPENRRRFLVEICREVRAQVGETYALSVKVNSSDFQKGGFGDEEAYELIEVLSGEGVDLFEISGGNYEGPAMLGALHDSTRKREAYFLEFAAEARKRTNVPIAVTGGFRSVKAMEDAVATGATDFVGLGRPLTLDPDLPHHAAADDGYVRDVGSPTTGFKSLDDMIMLDGAYYETQIGLMGRGKKPKPEISAWRTVWEIIMSLGMMAFKKRRA